MAHAESPVHHRAQSRGSILVIAATAGPTVTVDVGANRHPINNDVYGMSFADPGLATELGYGGHGSRFGDEGVVSRPASSPKSMRRNSITLLVLPSKVAVTRVGGANRDSTAEALALAAYPGTGSAARSWWLATMSYAGLTG